MTIRTPEESRRARHARCLPAKPVRPAVVRSDLAKDLARTSLGSTPYYDAAKAARIQTLPLFRVAEGDSVDEVAKGSAP